MAATLRAVASASGSGSSISCTKPTGTVESDLLLAFQTVKFSEFAAMSTPTGGAAWSLLGSQAWTGSDYGTKCWWKIAGASESASYGFAHTSGDEGIVAVAAIITPVTSAPIFASSSSESVTTSIPTPSVTPVAAEGLELRWAAGIWVESGSMSWTPPATYTEQVDRSQGTPDIFTSAISATLATKTLSSEAATGIQNFTDSGSASLFVHMGVTVAVAGTQFFPPRPTVLGQAVNRAATY